MYPTRAIIDRDALRHNFNYYLNSLAPAQPVPVIKSDAYGHGAVEVARTLSDCGCRQFAVFRIAEALDLRQHGITQPLWILLGALPNEADDAVGQNLKLAVFSWEQAVALNAAAKKHHVIQDVHLKVDTGMGRLGILPSEVPAFVARLATLSHLRLTGAFTHFAKAIDTDHPVTQNQIAAFRGVIQHLPASCTEIHGCATCAIAQHFLPELPYARPGISLYGLDPEPGMNLPIKPAMTFMSNIISLKTLPKGHNVSYNCIRTLERDTRVAVVPAGYASALPRALSDHCEALVRGHRIHNLGTICMDMAMFDVTDVPDVAVDDEVVFIGRQGDLEINAWDVARQAGTIAYDLLCHIGMTQPRFYIN